MKHITKVTAVGEDLEQRFDRPLCPLGQKEEGFTDPFGIYAGEMSFTQYKCSQDGQLEDEGEKIGIFGHSAGGYDAGHAMLAFPDV